MLYEEFENLQNIQVIVVHNTYRSLLTLLSTAEVTLNFLKNKVQFLQLKYFYYFNVG